MHPAGTLAVQECLKSASDAELVAVGQSETALQTLHDTITSKRFRTWQQTMESIMLRYVELCVELKKGKLAKDGLIQYRMSCQV